MKKAILKFKVFVDDDIYRVLEIQGSKSLYELATLIIKSYEFDMDHAFGFYDNIQNPYQSEEAYELFADMDEESLAHVKGVKSTHVSTVFEPGKEMLFLFDYGDEWTFLLTCEEIVEPVKGVKYPRIAEIVGKAPAQYEYDDEDDEDEAIAS